MIQTKKFHPLPAPGDIVWCHFPQTIGNPGPKPRPALVLAIAREQHAIQVAYGTSQKTHKLYPGEFVLDPSDAGFSVSGLGQRTKFDVGNRVQIYFDSDWFAPAPGQTPQIPLPKLGILHPSYMKAAKQALEQTNAI